MNGMRAPGESKVLSFFSGVNLLSVGCCTFAIGKVFMIVLVRKEPVVSS